MRSAARSHAGGPAGDPAPPAAAADEVLRGAGPPETVWPDPLLEAAPEEADGAALLLAGDAGEVACVAIEDASDGALAEVARVRADAAGGGAAVWCAAVPQAVKSVADAAARPAARRQAAVLTSRSAGRSNTAAS
jgi:hypothetical protein